jgi:hypothetical protein
MTLSDAARQARNEYMRQYKAKRKEKDREYNRQWRARNKDKVKQYQERYWERKAAALANVH